MVHNFAPNFWIQKHMYVYTFFVFIEKIGQILRHPYIVWKVHFQCTDTFIMGQNSKNGAKTDDLYPVFSLSLSHTHTYTLSYIFSHFLLLCLSVCFSFCICLSACVSVSVYACLCLSMSVCPSLALALSLSRTFLTLERNRIGLICEY